jgi:uncharacterized protein (DUF302 family)
MKKIVILIVLALGYINLSAQTLQPYTMGFETVLPMPEAIKEIAFNLDKAGFQVVGEYMPANDKNRYVIVVSHIQLSKAVETVGGLAGFAAPLRVGMTQNGEIINVSYTTPAYWGNAYYGDNFPRVEKQYKKVEEDFKIAMSKIGEYNGVGFGSEKGVEIDKLRKYHYMFGMPYFDDVVDLGDFEEYNKAVKTIDKNLDKGVPNVKLVYKLDIPHSDLTLYGFALSGEEGEAKFLPTIDITTPKHTAFLPYEVLVNGKEVVMLHGRFRIAIAFPDLKMGTFTKIMSTPGDIEDMLKNVVVDFR